MNDFIETCENHHNRWVDINDKLNRSRLHLFVWSNVADVMVDGSLRQMMRS